MHRLVYYITTDFTWIGVFTITTTYMATIPSTIYSTCSLVSIPTITTNMESIYRDITRQITTYIDKWKNTWLTKSMIEQIEVVDDVDKKVDIDQNEQYNDMKMEDDDMNMKYGDTEEIIEDEQVTELTELLISTIIIIVLIVMIRRAREQPPVVVAA